MKSIDAGSARGKVHPAWLAPLRCGWGGSNKVVQHKHELLKRVDRKTRSRDDISLLFR